MQQRKTRVQSLPLDALPYDALACLSTASRELRDLCAAAMMGHDRGSSLRDCLKKKSPMRVLRALRYELTVSDLFSIVLGSATANQDDVVLFVPVDAPFELIVSIQAWDGAGGEELVQETTLVFPSIHRVLRGDSARPYQADAHEALRATLDTFAISLTKGLTDGFRKVELTWKASPIDLFLIQPRSGSVGRLVDVFEVEHSHAIVDEDASRALPHMVYKMVIWDDS